ncbi:MAG: DNA-3-methyladenine glycosylase [Parachlamydiaceae bacterium]|nr:DNA-3-methyladenine glycosylase [Parachlamydiaceae bacterium]
MNVLPDSFYRNESVLEVSQQLLGKFLCTYIDGELTSGMITETEAYQGPEDRASHAYRNRRTKRTEVMFKAGGVSYVYLCYGIHSLFNVITNVEGIPHAVLIRAIKPVEGIECMLRRRKKAKFNAKLTSGPGALAQALGINVAHSGLSLRGPQIWIEDRGVRIEAKNIVASPRIGVDYAAEDALLPWRFNCSSFIDVQVGINRPL